jgi:hypothetical protein
MSNEYSKRYYAKRWNKVLIFFMFILKNTEFIYIDSVFLFWIVLYYICTIKYNERFIVYG